MSEYVLRGGDEGAARLRLLARVQGPATRALLRRAGIAPGWRCLDVGCGVGAVTLGMARLAGPGGLAVGLDRDEHFLAAGRLAAARAALPAVFRQGDAGDLNEPSAYDLVYARFLLSHLSDPGRVAAVLTRAARPGGVVAVEDVDFRGHFCHPDCPAFRRYVGLYRELVRRKGGDADLGPRLYGLLLDAGLRRLRLRVLLPTFAEGPGKRLAAVTLEHIRGALVAAGLAADAEVGALVAELDAFTADPRTLLSLPRIVQVWGRRPAP